MKRLLPLLLLFSATALGSGVNPPPPKIGGRLGGGAPGSMLFVGPGPVFKQDNANIFWDDTLNYLGIGTTTPSAPIHVIGTGSNTAAHFEMTGASPVIVNLKSDSSGSHVTYDMSPGGLAWRMASGDLGDSTDWYLYGSSAVIVADRGTGNVRIGSAYTTETPYRLTVDGTLGIQDASASFYSSFTGGTQTGNISYTLPTAAPSTNGQALIAQTSGVMSFQRTPHVCTRRLNTCNASTTCDADCVAGEIVMGGGCAGVPIAAHDGYPPDEDTFTCSYSSSNDITSFAICCQY